MCLIFRAVSLRGHVFNVTGDVAIALTNERGLDVPVTTTDQKDNTFRIEFEPQTVGQYNASVFFADQEIPSSPYRVNVKPSVDVSKVQIQGLDDSKCTRTLTLLMSF